MSEQITLDADTDIEALLADRPGERERYHDFYLGESDMRVICRALRGDPPRDDMEREGRRILLRGLLYQLSGYEELDSNPSGAADGGPEVDDGE